MPEKIIDFENFTEDEILGILNTALDDGEWHTPSASDLYIHTSNGFCIYGRCNISRHSQYHDVEHWFNINAYCVQIWKEEYVKGKANIHKQRSIYNIDKLVEKINKYKLNPQHNA